MKNLGNEGYGAACAVRENEMNKCPIAIAGYNIISVSWKEKRLKTKVDILQQFMKSYLLL